LNALISDSELYVIFNPEIKFHQGRSISVRISDEIFFEQSKFQFHLNSLLNDHFISLSNECNKLYEEAKGKTHVYAWDFRYANHR
jgi:hypothetical protein